MTLVERLRAGCVEHPRRWSGNTHDDLGGSVDATATDALMHEAADYITAQQRTIQINLADAHPAIINFLATRTEASAAEALL